MIAKPWKRFAKTLKNSTLSSPIPNLFPISWQRENHHRIDLSQHVRSEDSCERCLFGKNLENVRKNTLHILVFSWFFVELGLSRMRLKSEDVYMHKQRGTNQSKHLTGLKRPIKKQKYTIWRSREVPAKGTVFTGFQLLPVTVSNFCGPRFPWYWARLRQDLDRYTDACRRP